MLRAESTLLCTVAVLAPQFLLHLPVQAFFQHGLWVLAVQLLGIVLLAQPLIYCELALGQRSRHGPVKCWCFGPAWKGIGLLMLVTSALDLMSLNVDLLEYLKSQQQEQEHTGQVAGTLAAVFARMPLYYMQCGLWLVLLPLLVLWPKVSSKLWLLGSLVCLGGLIALSARCLTLSHVVASLERLWRLSARVPSNPQGLIRDSLLPFLSTAGTGVMVALGSYRPVGANAFADSSVIATLVFLLGALLTVSGSSLATNYCLTNSQLPTASDTSGSLGFNVNTSNRTMPSVACNLVDAACPMVALDAARNSSCHFLAYYEADTAENVIGGAAFYGRLLSSLPHNQVSPVAWLWCMRSVLAWLCLTHLLVRADTWVRAIADKIQGAERMRDCAWTARLLAGLLTCPMLGSLAYLMQQYRQFVSIRDVYQLSTVRWLPLLLGALACLAISHGYGGVRFVKELGGGAAMRPWFYALVGFITPALAIAVAGLRMHVSIAALLWPNGGRAYFNNSLISQRFLIPSYVSLLLAVSAFLFLLAGLFAPLLWQGVCRRRRCIDLVQPTKSWQRTQQQQQRQHQHRRRRRKRGRGGQSSQEGGGSGSEDSSANGGDIVRDLGATTIEESPMLHGGGVPSGAPRHLGVGYSVGESAEPPTSASTAATMSWPQRPLRSTAPAQASPPLPPPPPPPLAAQQQQDGSGGYGTAVRFHTSGRPAQQIATTYSMATLPSNSASGSAGVIRFNLNDSDNPTVTKTLNRGILKNKHESLRQQQQQQHSLAEAVPLANHGTVTSYNSCAGSRGTAANRGVYKGSTEIL